MLPRSIRIAFRSVLPDHSPRRRDRRRAFTLVELLVVIAIIGILAGILIPVVGRTRDTARGVQCLVNLRTLATAHAMYRNEFGGRTPPANTRGSEPYHPLSQDHKVWGIQLLRYYYRPGPNHIFAPGPKFIIDKTEICPAAASTHTSVNASEPGRDPDYGMQTHGDSANGDDMQGGNFDSFYQAPSRTPLFWDGWNAAWNSSRRMPPRHGGGNGINVAFLDGHTAYLPGSDQRLYAEWWSNASTKPQPDDSRLGKGDFLLSKERP
ncbi:prepilin-type N-terminal cleavage/methylation domain-containing protein [Opitutaceae bacterium TAV1]|nr:prepilin-type N-terminal cleavage/methylation domain-containing protein [Opitutaceae bacterium TAV1]